MDSCNVKFFVGKNGRLPTKAHDTDAGWDIYPACMERSYVLNGFNYYVYGTDLFPVIPEGYFLKVFPRSSISKCGAVMCNSVGIIDCDYRGEIKLTFVNPSGGQPFSLAEDKAIAQYVVERMVPKQSVTRLTREEFDSLDPTLRGSNGFGSSDSSFGYREVATVFSDFFDVCVD